MRSYSQKFNGYLSNTSYRNLKSFDILPVCLPHTLSTALTISFKSANMTRTPAAPEKHNRDSASRYKSGSKISTLFAEELVERSAIAGFGRKDLVVFDNACGTGAISSALHRALGDEKTRTWKLTCGDVSEAMVEVSKQKMIEEGWQNAEVEVVDAQNTGLLSDHYTHVFSAFGKMLGTQGNGIMLTSISAFNLFPDDKAAMEGWLLTVWRYYINEAS